MHSRSSKYEFSKDEFARAAAGEEPIRGRVISGNRGLAVQAAERWARRNPEMHIDDLIQAGSIGLIRAVDKFDPYRGFKFSTYAMWWINKEIRLEVAASVGAGRATKTEAQLFMSGRLPEERRTAYRRATGEHQCIDEALCSDSTTLLNFLKDDQWDGLEMAETRTDFESIMVCAQQACTNDQFEALCLRYGVLFSEAQSFESIAAELGLGSAAQAKDMVQAAKAAIRARMEG